MEGLNVGAKTIRLGAKGVAVILILAAVLVVYRLFTCDCDAHVTDAATVPQGAKEYDWTTKKFGGVIEPSVPAGAPEGTAPGMPNCTGGTLCKRPGNTCGFFGGGKCVDTYDPKKNLCQCECQ